MLGLIVRVLATLGTKALVQSIRPKKVITFFTSAKPSKVLALVGFESFIEIENEIVKILFRAARIYHAIYQSRRLKRGSNPRRHIDPIRFLTVSESIGEISYLFEQRRQVCIRLGIAVNDLHIFLDPLFLLKLRRLHSLNSKGQGFFLRAFRHMSVFEEYCT